ncbi:hypothetical protein WA026_007112 [Henosepilachna vigintioctopunctata]|uniref:LAGLIDADG homing endonuclease n=1 Tax=Henosepilachna vigintioctopunctata TaxID=420089 RepID=A0AAW1V9I6_9CUCU
MTDKYILEWIHHALTPVTVKLSLVGHLCYIENCKLGNTGLNSSHNRSDFVLVGKISTHITGYVECTNKLAADPELLRLSEDAFDCMRGWFLRNELVLDAENRKTILFAMKQQESDMPSLISISGGNIIKLENSIKFIVLRTAELGQQDY